MIFHSLDFVAFLAIVLAVYWALPLRGQNLFLLVASYFFYGYVHPWFLILIAASTIFDYSAALAMERWPERKKLLIAVSLIVNFGLLGTFKYFDFFMASFDDALESLGFGRIDTALHLVLPVGISFYTFQTLSYTIDVYRGKLAARRNLIDVALFVTFFPQLVAGPIERATDLLPQVEQKRRFDVVRAREGVLLMVWGFFKKMVIADNVAAVAEKVFMLESPSFFVLWAGVFAFCIQIYADFSAYTDIARGTAELMGFHLTDNFRHPYISRGPEEFWRRWHITLSGWFRDYVYIPLGGSRVSAPRWAINILIVFFLSGLWHGASWNFVAWGLYWALLILMYRAAAAVVPEKIRNAWVLIGPKILLMFVLTNIGWFLFRETDLSRVFSAKNFDPSPATPFEVRAGLYLAFQVLLFSVPLWIHSLYAVLAPRELFTSERHLLLRVTSAVLMFIAILTLRDTVGSAFIYFQF